MSTSEIERVPISKRLVLINSISGVITRLLSFGVFAWAIQRLVSQVPPEELALLPVVLSLTLLVPVVQSVLTAGLGRYVTEAYARNDLERITEIVSSILPWLVIGAAAVLVLGAVASWQVSSLLSVQPTNVWQAQFMLMLVAGRMACGLALAAHNTGVFARQAFVYQNLIQISGSCVQIVLLLVLLLGIGARVHWVVVAQVVAQTWSLILTSVLSVRLIPELRYRRSARRKHVLHEVLGFGGWFSILKLASTVRRAADPPILHRLATATDVTTFFLGSFIEDNIRRFIDLASQPLQPALTAMHAAGQKQRLAAAFLRGGRIGMWVALLAAVPLYVFRDELYRIYLGESYAEHADATTVLAFLLAGFVFTYPTRMIFSICPATAQVRPAAICATISACINVMLTIVLVGVFHLGAVGSAAATLVTLALVHPLLWWPLTMRMLSIPFNRFLAQLLVPGLVPTAMALPVTLLLKRVIGDAGIPHLASGIFCCLVTYTCGIAIIMKPADRKDLARILRFLHLWRDSRISS